MALRILHIDVETTPAQVYVWRLFDQNISVDQIIKPTSLLCFAAKWHGEPEIIFERSVNQEGPTFDRMVRRAHALLSEADAVCHYNGQAFDIPRLNVEFLRLGLAPTPPIPQIDLKKVVQSKFAFVSSKLAFIGPELKIGAKVQHEGWPLWEGCMKGDAASWKKMTEYNKQDVRLLERLYNKLLPWIDGHPNMNLYVDTNDPVCPNCASKNLHSRGLYRTSTTTYNKYHCNACGKWSRSRSRNKGVAIAERR